MRKVIPYVSIKSYVVLLLKFKFLIYLQLIFVYSVRWGAKFMCSLINKQFSQSLLSLFYQIVSDLHKNSWYVWIFFWSLYSTGLHKPQQNIVIIITASQLILISDTADPSSSYFFRNIVVILALGSFIL